MEPLSIVLGRVIIDLLERSRHVVFSGEGHIVDNYIDTIRMQMEAVNGLSKVSDQSNIAGDKNITTTTKSS